MLTRHAVVPNRDALPPRQLRRYGRQDALAVVLGFDVHERGSPRVPHRVRERPAPKQPPTEWAPPASRAVGVGTSISGETPPSPLVELCLVGKLLLLGRPEVELPGPATRWGAREPGDLSRPA